MQSLQDYVDHGLLPARLGVSINTAPITWKDFKQKSGITGETYSVLEEEAMKLGSDPGKWRVSFRPVLREKWLKVQLYTEG
jgi:hypothetical protein